MGFTCYLSLGTNEGDRKENLIKAISYISLEIGFVVQSSSIYECESWGYNDSRSYFNMVIKATTRLTAIELLEKCLDIEKKMGRLRVKPEYGPRIIDLDILFYEQLILEEPRIVIPHPRLHLRNFVLIPLCEISPELLHPVFNKTIENLKSQCTDSCIVKKILPLTR
jgi:2-amino-4-hydroxy-6-hydroxymethyldihydropteridine diphosphokinase